MFNCVVCMGIVNWTVCVLLVISVERPPGGVYIWRPQPADEQSNDCYQQE